MPAATLPAPLLIEQGATFKKKLGWSAGTPPAPVNLAGCKARMQLRADLDSPVIHELTTENGGITLSLGTIELMIPDEITDLMDWTTAVWDLEIVHPDGTVTRLVSGKAKFSRAVTR